MWSIVQVKESGTLALTQQLLALRANNLDGSTAQPEAESMEVCSKIIKKEVEQKAQNLGMKETDFEFKDAM